MSVHVVFTGLTRADQVEAAVAAGADYIGIALGDGTRGAALEAAADLALLARGAGFEGGLVGVLGRAEAADLEPIALACDLDVLHLDGGAPPAVLRAAAALRSLWVGLELGTETAPAALTEAASRAGAAEALVLDVGAARRAAGVAAVVSDAAAGALVRARRVVVAGDLDAAGVGEIVRGLDPFGVAMDGAGSAAMEAFVSAVRGAERTA